MNPEGVLAEANAHLGAGRFEAAVAGYRRALRAEPRYFEALANLGKAFERLGRWEEAVAAYRRALVLRKTEVPVLIGLGYVLASQGKLSESVAAYQQAAQLRPDLAQPWIGLGEMLQKAQRDAEALAAFDRALAIEPGNAALAFARQSLAGVQMDGPPAEYVQGLFDGFAAEFDRKLGETLEYRGPAVVAEALQPWLSGRDRLRILDLGCGTGLSGAFLRPRAIELVGVDLSRGMLDKARERGTYDRLEQGDIVEVLARWPARTVDLALALDVFIYVGALEPVMAAAAHALAPAGLMVFSAERHEEGDGFHLRPSGRYAHSHAYVERTAAASGLRIRDVLSTPLRKERGAPVASDIYTLMPEPAAG